MKSATFGHDGRIRDYQRRTAQWTVGKNFDGTGALGPWPVAGADLPPGAVGLKIESRLNGQVMQSSDTSPMLSPVVEALCLPTEAMTLEPGDVIAMGTPSGRGPRPQAAGIHEGRRPHRGRDRGQRHPGEPGGRRTGRAVMRRPAPRQE